MRPFRRNDEQGVALVEMVVVLPLLVLLALGIAEGAWAFAQQNAVRSMAREGARVAATHDQITPDLETLICGGADIVNTASLEASGVNTGSYERGDRGFFEVSAPYTPLTGFIPVFSSVTLTERVYFDSELSLRDLEPATQPAWWPASGGGSTC